MAPEAAPPATPPKGSMVPDSALRQWTKCYNPDSAEDILDFNPKRERVALGLLNPHRATQLTVDVR